MTNLSASAEADGQVDRIPEVIARDTTARSLSISTGQPPRIKDHHASAQ
jgi:hypothetical protein